MRKGNLFAMAAVMALFASPAFASDPADSVQACWQPAFEAGDADAVSQCYAADAISMVLVSKEDGKETLSTGRYTDVSRKVDGKWVYVVDHASENPPAAVEAAADVPADAAD